MTTADDRHQTLISTSILYHVRRIWLTIAGHLFHELYIVAFHLWLPSYTKET